MKKISFRTLYQAFLHLAVVALCFEIVYLANQNSKLKTRLEGGRVEEIKEGDKFAWSGLRLLDSKREIDTVSSSLVFVFTTSCPFCKQNVRSWKELAAVVTRDDLQVFGLSLDSTARTETYVKDSLINFPILIPDNLKNFYGSSRIFTVPKTLLISGRGEVEKMWRGLLKEEHIQEIRQSIHRKRTLQSSGERKVEKISTKSHPNNPRRIS